MDSTFKEPLWVLKVEPKDDPRAIMRSLAFGLAESCVQSAFGEILWADYQNGKLVLTEEQKKRIQELAEQKLNQYRKPPI